LLRPLVFVFPSLSPEVLAGEIVWALSRCRWHIALAMQRRQRLIPSHKRSAPRGRTRAAVSL